MVMCLCVYSRYLVDYSSWSQCLEPGNVVKWNIILFSILIALSALQVIICLYNTVHDVIRGLCGTHKVLAQVTIYWIALTYRLCQLCNLSGRNKMKVYKMHNNYIIIIRCFFCSQIQYDKKKKRFTRKKEVNNTQNPQEVGAQKDFILNNSKKIPKKPCYCQYTVRYMVLYLLPLVVTFVYYKFLSWSFLLLQGFWLFRAGAVSYILYSFLCLIQLWLKFTCFTVIAIPSRCR